MSGKCDRCEKIVADLTLNEYGVLLCAECDDNLNKEEDISIGEVCFRSVQISEASCLSEGVIKMLPDSVDPLFEYESSKLKLLHHPDDALMHFETNVCPDNYNKWVYSDILEKSL